jgi:hypothetical protein
MSRMSRRIASSFHRCRGEPTAATLPPCNHHQIGPAPGEREIMSRHDDGSSLGNQSITHPQNLLPRPQVQPSGGGVIDQKILRPHRQYPGQRHARLLPTAQRVGWAVEEIGHVAPCSGFTYRVRCFCRASSQMEWPNTDAVPDTGTKALLVR